MNKGVVRAVVPSPMNTSRMLIDHKSPRDSPQIHGCTGESSIFHRVLMPVANMNLTSGVTNIGRMEGFKEK